MAKGKHAAALFEVINPGRSPGRLSSGRLSSGRLSVDRLGSGRSSYRPRSTFLGTFLKTTAAPITAAGTALRSTAGALVVRSQIHARPAAPPKQAFSPVDMHMDKDRQLISFKLTYNSAIVAAFAVLVVIGLAYAVGRKMTRVPIAATNSPSTAELRAHGAHPEVLDVNSKAGPNAELLTGPPMAAAQWPAEAAPREKSGSAESNRTGEPTKASSSAAADRVIGRQYVIVQTFTEESTAQSAQAFLQKNHVSCTIENGLTGWAPKGKFCLIGTLGFDHLRGNADFEKYENNIARLGDAFADQTRSRHFEPRAYRWKGSTADSDQ